MSNRPVISTAAFFSAILMFAAAAPAARAETQSVGVQAGDLNLASDAGREILQRRITHAVEKVCGPAGHSYLEVQAFENCSKAARANATPQVDAIAVAQGATKVAAASR